MSLDISLKDPTETYHNEEELYWTNITHNLSRMATEAGIYEALWRPGEEGFNVAKDIIGILEEGLLKMKNDPEKFKKFNSPNGWGRYEHFIPFVEAYLNALRRYPEALIEANR